MVVFSLTEIVRDNLRNLDLKIVKWYGKFSLNSTLCVSKSVVTSLSEDDFKIKITLFLRQKLAAPVYSGTNLLSGIDDFFDIL